MCTAGMVLGDYERTVIEDAGGSGHLLILTSFQSLNVPTNLFIPIFDLSRHISWSMYVDAMLDSLATAAREEADVEKRYENFIGMIRSSAEFAQTRTQRRHRTVPFFRRFAVMPNATA
jgi:ABC-type transport system substrate-binding protein